MYGLIGQDCLYQIMARFLLDSGRGDGGIVEYFNPLSGGFLYEVTKSGGWC